MDLFNINEIVISRLLHKYSPFLRVLLIALYMKTFWYPGRLRARVNHPALSYSTRSLLISLIFHPLIPENEKKTSSIKRQILAVDTCQICLYAFDSIQLNQF